MTTRDAFAHWTGDACTGDRKRLSLFGEAAEQLGQQYPCCAGKSVSGEGFTEAADRSAWRHAVGAKAASLFLLSPDGRKALTSTTDTTASEAGEGTACDPKVTTETVQAGARLDPDNLATLAEADAVNHMMQISCVSEASQSRASSGTFFRVAGARRSRRCGCR